MATTLHNPVTTKFHGHIGGIIYYVVRNQQRMRSLPSAVRNPRSSAQVAHRTRFATANSLAAVFKNIYKLGYRNNQQTDRNDIPLDPRAAFAKHIYHDALDADNNLDPTKLILSQGTLPQFNPLTSSIDPRTSTLSLRWSISGGAPTDRLCVVLYNYTRNQATFLQDIVSRQERHTTVTIPANYQNDHIYIYCFWHNPDNTTKGNKNHKVSTSVLVAQLNNPDTQPAQSLDHQLHLYHLTAPWKSTFRRQLTLPQSLPNPRQSSKESNSSPPDIAAQTVVGCH